MRIKCCLSVLVPPCSLLPVTTFVFYSPFFISFKYKFLGAVLFTKSVLLFWKHSLYEPARFLFEDEGILSFPLFVCNPLLVCVSPPFFEISTTSFHFDLKNNQNETTTVIKKIKNNHSTHFKLNAKFCIRNSFWENMAIAAPLFWNLILINSSVDHHSINQITFCKN